MPDVVRALVHLGKFVGFFAGTANDDAGTVQWTWFGDPIGKAFEAMPPQRDSIGKMLRALLDRQTAAGAFDSDNDWEPVVDVAAIDGGFGVTWSTGDPLVIGVGANAKNVGIETITLSILAKLLEIVGGSNPSASHRLGDVAFTGTFPVPEFLASGELEGAITADPFAVNVALTATAPPAPPTPENSRTLSYPVPGPDGNEILGWDAARLTVFVLKAFVADRAAQGEEFFQRVLEHLFPLLGDDPADVIDPLPIAPVLEVMGQSADFDPWSQSVLPGDDADGALTFLWHLRALLTGNEDPSFFEGSYFFRIEPGPASPGPPAGFDPAGPLPSAPGASAWVGVLTEPANGFTFVIDLYNAASQRRRIPIAVWDGANLTRPPLPTAWPDLTGFGAGPPVTVGSQGLTLLSHTVTTGPAAMNGPYEVVLKLAGGSAPAFEFKTPDTFPNLTFPPDPTELAAEVVSTIVTAASAGIDPDAKTEFQKVVDALAHLAKDAIRDETLSGKALLAAIVALASAAAEGDGATIPVPISDDVKLDLGLAGDLLGVKVEFGPVDSGSDDPDLVIGKVFGEVSILLSGGHVLDGFQLGFEDLRFANRDSGGGIVATLIPEMREMPGFGLQLDYSASQDEVIPTGGGKIPIQRTFGPLEIAALLVDLRKESFAIGLDLGFELGPIMVAAYELGLEVVFDTGSVTPFLHGLGLAMDTDTIKLGGFFAAVDRPFGTDADGDPIVITDYIGGAVVSVAGYFELSAIGGYTQIPGGDPSLFIFASLVAPLGGPPWFFMTGVAGGFGLNRSLPSPELMLDHPFLKVMRGELDVSGEPGDALTKLADLFAAEEGQFWIAAGIQFISFGFITGRVVVAIAFGHKFSFTILGMASFSLEPIAYIEIGILTTVDEEKFVLRASLSPNSYILHPDIFSLQGDIALCAWYAKPHDGDFLFSIGGYHPEFKKPDHYPELVRVGAKATLYDFVNLSVEVFFACTPQALMAGAKAALWAEFMGIAAGCEVYVDVLITWDPFFLRARLGVVLWFEFFGRHEIGVQLDIFTPEFGGTAEIDLAIVSFEVSFGAELDAPDPPTIAMFMTKQLALPATEFDGAGARVPTFNTADASGLLRVEFLSGRVGAAAFPEESEQQEGTDSSAPVHLGPEWSFLVRTRLPIDPDDVPAEVANHPRAITGMVNLPLCEKLENTSGLTVTSAVLDHPDVSDGIGCVWLTDFHPAATFGPAELQTGQTGTQAAAALDSATPSIPLVEGMVVDCGPEHPPAPSLDASGAEKSTVDEVYPAPLGDEAPGSLIGVIDRLSFAAIQLHADLPARGSRRDSALAALRGRTRPPLRVLLKSAALLNTVKQSAGKTFSVAAAGAAAIPRMAPPASPARSVELQQVSLKVLPVRSDHATRARRLDTVARPAKYAERFLTKPDGVRGTFRGAVEVPAGEARIVEFSGGNVAGAALRMSGDQHVRTVAFDLGGDVLLDRHTRGAGALELPVGTATAVLVGTGRAGAPAVAGVERDTTLLSVSPRRFLAPGCVVTTRTPLPVAVHALDGMPGAELFAGSRRLEVAFPRIEKAAALVIRVVPVVERPEPAERQVRWRAVGARLRDLVPVVGPDRVSLTMAVIANRPWQLEVDLGPQWRLDGIALVPGGTERLVAQLRRGGGRDLVDDAIAPADGLVTMVDVEATTR